MNVTRGDLVRAVGLISQLKGVVLCHGGALSHLNNDSKLWDILSLQFQDLGFKGVKLNRRPVC